jgi:hypothetical protein
MLILRDKKMKMRLIKLSPELLIELLQGTAFNSNMPKDCELLDLKYDLFSHEVQAIVRSDSFQDVAETYPIPEFNLSKTPSSNPSVEPAPVAAKPEVKPAPKTPVVSQQKTVSKMEDEFSPEQRRLLVFTQKDDCVIVKPAQFLKAEWADINDVVKSIGGKWVKGDIISYWEIPLTQT